jgi:hypothetical protein
VSRGKVRKVAQPAVPAVDPAVLAALGNPAVLAGLIQALQGGKVAQPAVPVQPATLSLPINGKPVSLSVDGRKADGSVRRYKGSVITSINGAQFTVYLSAYAQK